MKSLEGRRPAFPQWEWKMDSKMQSFSSQNLFPTYP